MYRQNKQFTINDFKLPFEGKLSSENRWVRMAEETPWDEIEKRYASLFTSELGNVAKPARMAVGALIIKVKCGYSDRETVQQISENPYMQYFIGLKEFKPERPFNPSLMSYFRKRLNFETMQDINELICKGKDNDEEPPSEAPPSSNEGHNQDNSASGNSGTLLIDGTCAPADIRYPTDLSLLNEGREKLEGLIDFLHQSFKGKTKKPRTYRQKAREQYLAISKKRNPGKKQLRRALRQQLGYIQRDLKHIDRYLKKFESNPLDDKQQEQLEVIQELYYQQKYMYDHKKNSVPNRIVSISQPHVRPIVRGKAGAPTEFGAKISVSLVNGYTFIDKLDWNNFNEGTSLISSVEKYYHRYGFYPKEVLVDAIYRTRDNIRYCKDRGIRLSGPRLGRPPASSESDKKQQRQDAKDRNAIEGKLGIGKRRYGLARIMARLQETSETVIALQFLVMNLEHRLRILLSFFTRHLFWVFKERFFGVITPASNKL